MTEQSSHRCRAPKQDRYPYQSENLGKSYGTVAMLPATGTPLAAGTFKTISWVSQGCMLVDLNRSQKAGRNWDRRRSQLCAARITPILPLCFRCVSPRRSPKYYEAYLRATIIKASPQEGATDVHRVLAENAPKVKAGRPSKNRKETGVSTLQFQRRADRAHSKSVLSVRLAQEKPKHANRILRDLRQPFVENSRCRSGCRIKDRT